MFLEAGGCDVMQLPAYKATWYILRGLDLQVHSVRFQVRTWKLNPVWTGNGYTRNIYVYLPVGRFAIPFYLVLFTCGPYSY